MGLICCGLFPFPLSISLPFHSSRHKIPPLFICSLQFRDERFIEIKYSCDINFLSPKLSMVYT